MSRNWSEREVHLVVADYFAMLSAELKGEPYSKTAHRRILAPLLDNRTKSAIERKHQNVTAILDDLDHPSINGYKPLPNYQRALFDEVFSIVHADHVLSRIVRDSVEAPARPVLSRLLKRWVDPPESSTPITYQVQERPHPRRLGVNWLQVESRNQLLGLAGEQFVLAFEQARLRQAGKDALAERIEHVALTRGDGEGFDVRSFEVNGTDRLIEVKTTANGKQTPFFLSRNELRVSQTKAQSYHLYRVFRFRRDPRVFGLRGALDQSCYLDPVQFAARVK